MKNKSPKLVLCALCFSLLCNAQKIEQKIDLAPFSIENEHVLLDYKASLQKYSTLLKVLEASKLDKVLGYNGDFTVFAPSNIAFEKLTNYTVEDLLKPKNQKILKGILSRHIIAGKLTASSILIAMCRGNGEATFTTIHGDKLKATMSGLNIILTDKSGNKAVITAADSNYANGVVHEIDSVLVPVVVL